MPKSRHSGTASKSTAKFDVVPNLAPQLACSPMLVLPFIKRLSVVGESDAADSTCHTAGRSSRVSPAPSVALFLNNVMVLLQGWTSAAFSCQRHILVWLRLLMELSGYPFSMTCMRGWQWLDGQLKKGADGG
ncbi:hypothetical protein TOPH_06657 [Tolypocladium ophioglossoides CBS 100239]|uniref:Uncharacterized protein n=1 Tax=Tolypocladium ophioglossoides (strain CBS 100239) TaxID=1163406 RepID=A0A0L0N3P8_TOLOC|nr:hypothetical protein TOPH_06657 [Tolypocladium ophioglossoides CBS 100239]